MKPIYFLLGLILLLSGGCASGEQPIPDNNSGGVTVIDGDKILLELGIDMPQMGTVGSRALSDAPDYTDMHLYLVEFDDNGSPLRNTLKKVYQPEYETPDVDRVHYKVVLDMTQQSRIIHLIVLPKDQEFHIDYGVEATIIPSLTVSGDTPAYWRRLSFPNGYCSIDDAGFISLTPETEQLRHVAMVRNFASIEVVNAAEGFTLKGFAIVNSPNSGTIAPFNRTTVSFPDFLDSNQQILPYSTVSAEYSGLQAPNLLLSNPAAGPDVPLDVSPKMMYERPASDIRHTFIIIRGRREEDEEDQYYKLDLGRNNELGVFVFYGMLRNYRFRITLNSVEAAGNPNPTAAANGYVFNNFSFDVLNEDKLNTTDGNEIVYVTETTKIVTDTENQTTWYFRYRFRNLGAGSSNLNDPSLINFPGLEVGPVIASYEIAPRDSGDWRTIKIVLNKAEDEFKEQTFYVVKPSGLGRKVTVGLHAKWELEEPHVYGEWITTWDNSTPHSGQVNSFQKAPFTLFFDLPDGLSRAIFPLEFTIEADRENIENAFQGNMNVSQGPSLFSGVQGRRIQFKKIISWEQYNDPAPTDNEDFNNNGTVITRPGNVVIHRVRCLFRTTTTTESGLTTIRISNPNFIEKDISFSRVAY